MYLLDTNVISELRKGRKGDPGVHQLLQLNEDQLFIPVQVLGELQFGIESLRLKGDLTQSEQLRQWMATVLESFEGRILVFDQSCALLWGRLRGGNDQNLIDKQIAAIAIIYGLIIVTRNVRHYENTGARMVNPFLADLTHGTSAH
jgi:toxin FitB